MRLLFDHPIAFDFVVYGAGFSGVGAALAFGRSGYRVGLIETAGEIPIRGTHLVWPTPLNPSVDTGPLIDESTNALLVPGNNIWPLSDRGERVDIDDGVVVGYDPFTDKTSWTARHLVFAHPGQHREAPSYLSSLTHRLGTGISFDAWADAPFFEHKTVCVFGDGFYALDQARWAARHVAEIVVCCETNTFCEDLDLFEPSLVPDNCTLFESVRAITVQENDDATFLIRATRPSSPFERRVDGLFWAADLVSGRSLLGDSFARLHDRALMTVAGVDNGIAYWDFNALYRDGQQAARHLIDRLG